MEGPSDSNLSPQEAAIANLNYRDALRTARKLIAQSPLDTLLTLSTNAKDHDIVNPKIKVAKRETQIWEVLKKFDANKKTDD